MSMSLPLPVLYSQILLDASQVSQLSAIEDSTQELIQPCLVKLQTLRSRISELALFSPNESLEDIATKDLIYLSVPYVFYEVQGRVKVTEIQDRLVIADRCKDYLSQLIMHLENYGIIPQDERTLYERRVSAIANPANRRELKIKQYQKEKDIRARIQIIRKRRGQVPKDDETPNSLDLIQSLLPSLNSAEEESSETDEVIRDATLLLLRLLYAQAHGELESTIQELEMLKMASPPPPPPVTADVRSRERESESNMWKLDTPSMTSKNGPLLDPTGKPLRPFTILPAGTGDRARMQAQVFRPGHELPSMSIDEYLEIERQRGKFISGGGPASEAEPTSSEKLALDAEMDGTLDGEEKEEQKRQKDENWARFTDENLKGSGNTMNRG